jgi:nicotinic acid mononucleotide adenylyltransferase
MSNTKRETNSNKKEDKPKQSGSMGIYWGTFDPPTLAHGNIIETAIRELKLSKLIVAINDHDANDEKDKQRRNAAKSNKDDNKKQDHKETKDKENKKPSGKIFKTPGVDRARMLRSMLSEPAKKHLTIARQTGEFSVAYESFKKDYPDLKIHIIVGQDSFEDYLKYGATFAKYDHIVIVPRGENNNKLKKEIETAGLTNTTILNIDPQFLNTSSTIVRSAVDKKQDDVLSKHIHPSVKSYIQQHSYFKESFFTFKDNLNKKHHTSAITIQHAYRNWKKKTGK